jgi:hypothetical protein
MAPTFPNHCLFTVLVLFIVNFARKVSDFIVHDIFVGVRSCGRKRCVREIIVSRARDPVHAGDKALTRETPAKRGRVNRYEVISVVV